MQVSIVAGSRLPFNQAKPRRIQLAIPVEWKAAETCPVYAAKTPFWSPAAGRRPSAAKSAMHEQGLLGLPRRTDRRTQHGPSVLWPPPAG